MQRFSQKESVVLGNSPQKAFTDQSSSPQKSRRNSDRDFKDVFGDPPGRPSIQETIYGFGEHRRTDEPVVAGSSRNPLSGLSEKPAFGEEEMARRRRSKSDFFRDIFRGNESSSSSRKYEMNDSFAPGSQSMSPALQSLNLLAVHLLISGQANQDKEDPRNGFQSSYCFSEGNEESTNSTKNAETERKGNSNEDSSSSGISKYGNWFHFSIYKWANKGGVPVANPLRGSDRRKEKDKLQRSISANGWIAHESIAKEPRDKLHNRFFSFDGRSSSCKSFRVEHYNNEKSGSLIDSRNDGELCRIIEEDNITKPESEIINELKNTVKNVSKGEVSAVGNATQEPQPKPLNLLFDNDNDDERGNGKITKNYGNEGIPEMNANKLSEILDNKNTKKQDVKKRVTSNVETSATSVKHSPRKSWDNGKARVRGKIKELIKIFNQDASSRPRTDAALSENHGSSRKERDKVKSEIEPNIIMNTRVEKVHLNSVIKKKPYSDIPVARDMCTGASENNLNSSVKDSVADDSKTIIEDLTPGENDLPKFGIDPADMEVLWPGCGWKPVPLVDIIEGPAVKRSYQKALLCLHPDKLQQKGAASDQKYIAQQVFDILQGAWTHFNSLASV
ncbi:J-domain protein required for chloroplast accumulation response 1, putative isoform 3 [Hibiscus syriacus]|uniref:J-domain protein required for chloroplast accumulation response 1, putative isoform 3 n=1 Tax=Hibiscus syriacus TaxID=106335 RepID=A0A6A2XY87_HIBSY|nr:J-domain protein required for chloroplast accumulation response 1, putative isoform 3 [Hibiscus syriacus]